MSTSLTDFLNLFVLIGSQTPAVRKGGGFLFSGQRVCGISKPMKNITLRGVSCSIGVQVYASKAPAARLQAYDEEGPFRTLTVALPDVDPPVGHIIVKDYSENSGTVQEMEDQGFAKVVCRLDVGHVLDGAALMLVTDPDLVSGIKKAIPAWDKSKGKGKGSEKQTKPERDITSSF